jgi:hypothetical protein
MTTRTTSASLFEKRPRRWALVALVALGLPALGCTNNGGECDRCESNSDCDTELRCVEFRNPDETSAGKRCGSGTGATQCRVR